METLKLESEIRTDSGKGVARKLRASGRIPAVLYGRKKKPVSLEIDEPTIRGILHAHPEAAVIDLTIKGEKSSEPINVIIRDVQRHPATGKLLHVDFQRIKFGEKLRVEVKMSVVGTPRGVKEQGGILEHGIRSVQVMCLPRKIPESIEIDVTGLMIGDSIKLRDIVESNPDMDFLDDVDTTLAHVIPPIIEAKPAEAEGAEEEEAEPELVARDKDAADRAEERSGDKESA